MEKYCYCYDINFMMEVLYNNMNAYRGCDSLLTFRENVHVKGIFTKSWKPDFLS